MMPSAPLLVLCGPTAVGKTAAAIVLAERLGAEIVCADSRTLYRRMDIGTTKPTPAQQARVPHHLLDIADPGQAVTLADYGDRATQAIRGIRTRGRVPILAGGTGLYIRAIVDGYTIPKVPPDETLRQRLEALERATPGALHRRLNDVDPVAAARIHPRNTRRIIRALEVFEHTGAPISTLQRRADSQPDAVQIALTVDRSVLYRRIDERVDAQLAVGLLDEVRTLLAHGYAPSLPALQSLGYKEMIEHLQGRVALDEAARRLKRNTRRFAKRQYTWFRRDTRIRWLDVDEWSPEEVADRIIRMVESNRR